MSSFICVTVDILFYSTLISLHGHAFCGFSERVQDLLYKIESWCITFLLKSLITADQQQPVICYEHIMYLYKSGLWIIYSEFCFKKFNFISYEIDNWDDPFWSRMQLSAQYCVFQGLPMFHLYSPSCTSFQFPSGCNSKCWLSPLKLYMSWDLFICRTASP